MLIEYQALKTAVGNATTLGSLRNRFLELGKRASVMGGDVPAKWSSLKSTISAGRTEKAEERFGALRGGLLTELFDAIKGIEVSGGDWSATAKIAGDPLRAHARYARRGLVAGTGFLIFVNYATHPPTEIPLLGLKELGLGEIFAVLTAFTAYSAISFVLYSYSAWSLRKRELRVLAASRDQLRGLEATAKAGNALPYVRSDETEKGLLALATRFRNDAKAM